jgi:PBSX family phage portal protein
MPRQRKAPALATEDEEVKPERAIQMRVLALSANGKSPNQSEALAEDPFAEFYAGADASQRVLPPPLGPQSFGQLITFAEESNILPQCIRAFEINIDGFGHRLELAVPQEEFPKDQEAKAKEEKERLQEFLTYAYDGGSFVGLRRQTRHDMETCGIGYWEIIRGPKDEIGRLNHVPGHMVRMTSMQADPVTVTELRRRGLELVPVQTARRFRLYLQITSLGGKQRKVWFKEFGDPRHVDLRTGEISARNNLGKFEANEILAFPLRYYALSPYSLPRWLGNLPSVLGSRAAEEVNLLFFDNKTIPPLVITVSGGQLTKGTITRIRETIEHEIKGRENFHKALILEAMAPEANLKTGTATAPRIEIKPLTSEQLTDAMFLGYDEANRTKTRSSFGLAPIFIGETVDYNRATSDTSRFVVEEQVFRPERIEWDFTFNRRLMPALGIARWMFVSNGPNVTLNEDIVASITTGDAAGAMTPNLARVFLSDVLERPLPRIEEEWGDVPFALTLAQMSAALGLAGLGGGQPAAAPPNGAEGARLSSQMAAVYRLLAKRLPAQIKDEVVREVRALIQKELGERRKRATRR